MTVDTRPAAIPEDTRTPAQIARQRARQDRLPILSQGHRKFGMRRLFGFWLCSALNEPAVSLMAICYEVLMRDECVSPTPRDIAALWLLGSLERLSDWLELRVDPWWTFVQDWREQFEQKRRAAAARAPRDASTNQR